MRIEINGAKGISVSQYQSVRSKLETLLSSESFETVGSGFGGGVINIGFAGKGPLTTDLVKRIEDLLQSEDIGIGFDESRVTLTVFSE